MEKIAILCADMLLGFIPIMLLGLLVVTLDLLYFIWKSSSTVGKFKFIAVIIGVVSLSLLGRLIRLWIGL